MLLFHLSPTYLGNKKLFIPRVPAAQTNWFVRNGYEDATTPRICTSTTIEGCLVGINKMEPLLKFYVYRFAPIESAIVKPEELLAKKYVPDAAATNEHWIIEPTMAKLYARIEITEFPAMPITTMVDLKSSVSDNVLKSIDQFIPSWRFLKIYYKNAIL
jgi:hypothetical protein